MESVLKSCRRGPIIEMMVSEQQSWAKLKLSSVNFCLGSSWSNEIGLLELIDKFVDQNMSLVSKADKKWEKNMTLAIHHDDNTKGYRYFIIF